MASIEHYLGDPAVRRAAWQNRLHSPAWQAKPNAGHFAVAQLERLGKLEALITQNVDGLHQAAGNSAEKVIEIHGTIHEVSCLKCGDRAPMERALERVRAGEEDPPCRSCGGILKSATISFARSQRVAEDCDLLLAVGSTLGVYPAAGAVPIAQQAGARIVILNAEPTELDHLADVLLRGSISQILPQLVAAAQ